MAFDRNTIAAFVLAILVLLGWEFFLAPKVTPKPPVTAEKSEAPATPAAPPAIGETPAAPAVEAPTPAEQTGEPEKRIRISTPSLHGSLTLTGGRLDDITLVKYRESLDPKSPEIVLLSPTVAPKPYYAEMGWITSDAGVAVPTPSTVWSTDNAEAGLTEKAPVVLTWDNGQGLKFKRTISVDQDYLFTVEQTVENTSEKPVTLYPYGLLARLDGLSHSTTYILHEGPIGVFNRTLKEVKYDALKKETREQVESTGGWIGITDKYWLAAIAFDQNLKVTASFNHAMSGERDRYQTDMRADAVTVAPGENKTVKGYVFAGAKELQILDNYADNVGISRLDLAIDFGLFFYLTKPFFVALRWLHAQLGNFGVAILVFSTFIRLLMFPIANKQFASMNNMKRVQPELKRLQERYANDRQKQQQEMMELYKREKINPLAGCLPILLQIPVFFALYKVLFVSIEMRHAPFYGWIHDLSAADPTGVLTLFGLLPYTVPAMIAFLNIGAWPLIYGVTMFFQQRMMPQQGDPTTQRIMMYMPLIFTFVLASMPAGLVIYWSWSNLLGILQQWILLKRQGIKV
jgi:YidC/Oxa1 family membrane protein insertase